MGAHPQLRLTSMQDRQVREIADQHGLSQAGAIRRLVGYALGWGQTAIHDVEEEIVEFRLMHEAEAGHEKAAAVRTSREIAAQARIGAGAAPQFIRRVRLNRTLREALAAQYGEHGAVPKQLKAAFLDGIGRHLVGYVPPPGAGTFGHNARAQAAHADFLNGIDLRALATRMGR